MPDPVSHGQMMNYLVRNSEDKKRMREYFETNQITTASNINRPREPKLTQIFQDFNERNPLADGGRIGFNNGSPDNLTKQKIAAKKYGMSLKKYQKLSQEEKTKLKDKAKREADKAAGVSVDGERVSKNIRKLPNNTFRFETESGGGFSKIFPKGTTLKQAEKFRDEYMKDLDKKGLLKKRNPKRGEYKSVEGQKHIKFNGVNYQVSLQRGDEGAQYFSSLKDAIKERDRLVKKYPPKSFRDFNIKERPKKVNAEILQLSKNPTIKNIFKTGKLTDEAITKAANILGVNRATAIDRLEDLATAYTGDRKNVPGIKPAFIKNARNIVALLPGAKTKAAELATGVPFIGESIKVPKQEIVAKADYPTDIVDIDEARATATGLKRGTSPYSIFGQIIDSNVNRVVKGGFGGAGWDSRAGTLEKNLDDAIKNFGANSKEARAAKAKYNQEATKFENEVNSKKLRGAKRVRIPRISLDAPSQTIANYNKFNKKYKNIFDQNFKTKQYSFVIPKDLKTIPELRNEILDPNSSTYKNMINTLKKGFNEFDEKKLFDKIQNTAPKQLQRIMKLIPRIASVDDFETNRFASADNIMTDATVVDDETFAERNPVTTGAALTGAGTAGVLKAAGVPIRQAAGKAFRTLGTRAGVLPFAGLTVKDNLAQGENIVDATLDPLVGAELLVPRLFPEIVSKITKNPTLQRALTLGKYGRALTPIGAGITAAGLGIDLAKFTRDRINELRAMSPEERAELRRQGDEFAFSEFAAAGGGIAKLAGDPSGPPPKSGPNSQGLSGLLKRANKI